MDSFHSWQGNSKLHFSYSKTMIWKQQINDCLIKIMPSQTSVSSLLSSTLSSTLPILSSVVIAVRTWGPRPWVSPRPWWPFGGYWLGWWDWNETSSVWASVALATDWHWLGPWAVWIRSRWCSRPVPVWSPGCSVSRHCTCWSYWDDCR